MPTPNKPVPPLGDIAVLIDFENINDADIVERVYDICATRGNVVSRKAVADWSGDTKTVQRALVAIGTELVHQFSAGKGKNSSDVRIVIEAMDLHHDPAKDVDTFVFATSDGDFVPLVQRLRSAGKRVIVVSGPAPVSTTLVQSADEAIDGLVSLPVPKAETDDDGAAAAKPAVAANGKPTAAKPAASTNGSPAVSKALKKLVLATFDEILETTGETSVDSNTLIQGIRKKQPQFLSKTHGFKTFKSLLRAIPELNRPTASRSGPYKVSRK